MVGDSYEADVEGARAMGWRAVHYAPDGDSPDGDDAIPAFEALIDRLT
jgi:FMN phosphatase YigB (HAD superfamily)